MTGLTKDVQHAIDRIFQIFELEKRCRIIPFQIHHIPVLIALNDIEPNNITLRAYMPTMEDASIGHVFITGREGCFNIVDIFVNPKYKENHLGSKLMEEVIKVLSHFAPAIVTGKFTIQFKDIPLLKHFFEKFNFKLDIEPDSKLSIVRELA